MTKGEEVMDNLLQRNYKVEIVFAEKGKIQDLEKKINDFLALPKVKGLVDIKFPPPVSAGKQGLALLAMIIYKTE